MTKKACGLMAAAAAACLAVGCGGGSGDDVVDGATQGDGGNTVDGSTTLDASTTVDAATGGPLTVSGFDVYTSNGARFITCDPTGACYGNRGGVNMLAPNGTAWSSIGGPANGLNTTMASSILRDPAGNLYSNGCGGAMMGPTYKLPVGTTQWIAHGTGLTASAGTSCNYNTLGMDAAGTLYVGFATMDGLWKLPAAATAWVDTTTPPLSSVVWEVATRGNDVYAATRSGVALLASGSTAWVGLGTGLPGNVYHIRIDNAGNVYATTQSGSVTAGVYKLAMGATAWVETTNLNKSDLNSPRVSDIVFDAMNNGYIISRPTVVAGGYALMKLTAGTTAWTKLVDLPTLPGTEDCLAMADDHIGHLVVQCTTRLLRSKP